MKYCPEGKGWFRVERSSDNIFVITCNSNYIVSPKVIILQLKDDGIEVMDGSVVAKTTEIIDANKIRKILTTISILDTNLTKQQCVILRKLYKQKVTNIIGLILKEFRSLLGKDITKLAYQFKFQNFTFDPFKFKKIKEKLLTS